MKWPLICSAFAALTIPTLAHADDGDPVPVKFRNGFSASLSEEFGRGFSGQLYGVDWRIGAQINRQLGIYLDNHLSFGSVHATGGGDGITGDYASAITAEYTFPAAFFVGGGLGYGVLNNPSGPLVLVRAGWYPFQLDANQTERHLNLAFDARFYFPGDPVGETTQLAISIGYDRF